MLSVVDRVYTQNAAISTVYDDQRVAQIRAPSDQLCAKYSYCLSSIALIATLSKHRKHY